jgi:ankyrin repeat protein
MYIVYVLLLPEQKKNTALHIAAEVGHTRIVSMLIEKGASITTRDKEGANALHRAARVGQIAVCALLLDKGSPINEQDWVR